MITGTSEFLILGLISQNYELTAPRIRELFEQITGRKLSVGAAYTTLERLVGKQFLLQKQQPARPVRGGRRIFAYTLTDKGALELQETTQALKKVLE